MYLLIFSTNIKLECPEIEQTIFVDTTTILFHEIGEARIGKSVNRSSVVDYENIVRKVLRLEFRPYDADHSPLGGSSNN